MTRFRLIARPLAAVCMFAALSACSWFNRPAPYADSRGSVPLQIPDRLDRPALDPALSVPAINSGAGDLLARDGQRPPELGDPGVSTDLGSVSESAFASSFTVDDAAENVYRRVGLALERVGRYPILARDAGRSIYRVEVITAPTEKGRWWKFWSRAKPVRSELVIQVAANGAQATVSVLNGAGDPSASAEAGEVLSLLKDRLSG